MDFSHKKLPLSAAQSMRRCPVDTIAPYAPLLAPIYLFMRVNEKFVAIKGPLDFFTPIELDRYRETVANFFVTDFVDRVVPIRDVARSVSAILSWRPRPETWDGVHFQADEVDPAPFEISDAILRAIAPLWSPASSLEPFFASVFATELCGILPPDDLVAAHDLGSESYERALYGAGLGVVLALQLGICQLDYLRRLRDRIFLVYSTGVAAGGLIEELAAATRLLVEDSSNCAIRVEEFSRLSKKMSMRLGRRAERLVSELLIRDLPPLSVSGAGGFRGA